MDPMAPDAPRPNYRPSLPFTFLTLLLAGLCTSCAETPAPTQPPQAILQPPPTQRTGESLFLAQQLPDALLQFEHDYETALSPEDRQRAFYNLTSTQLALATGDEQLLKAIANIEAWAAEHVKAPGEINPRLLVAAFKTQVEKLQKKSQELGRLIKHKNGTIASHGKKLEELAEVIDKLEKQLRELEAIDATLQEKRKGL